MLQAYAIIERGAWAAGGPPQVIPELSALAEAGDFSQRATRVAIREDQLLVDHGIEGRKQAVEALGFRLEDPERLHDGLER